MTKGMVVWPDRCASRKELQFADRVRVDLPRQVDLDRVQVLFPSDVGQVFGQFQEGRFFLGGIDFAFVVRHLFLVLFILRNRFWLCTNIFSFAFTNDLISVVFFFGKPQVTTAAVSRKKKLV